MKRIAPLATTTQGYPPLQNNPNGPAGWDFLQLALQDCISAIMKDRTNSTATVIMLAGASVTIAGGNYSTTAGWIWYTGDAGSVGELFYLPAIGSTTMGGHSYLNAAVDATTSAADPIQFIGGASLSPHVNRQIVLTPAVAPSAGAYSAPTASLPYGLITNLPDATLWALAPGAWIAIAGGIGYTNSWADYGAPLAPGRFRKEGGYVVLSGGLAGGATNSKAFTLPAGYLPAYNCAFPIAVNIGGANPSYGYMTVNTGGDVLIFYQGTLTFLSLEGIRIPLS